MWTHFGGEILKIDEVDEELITKSNLLEVGFPYGKLFIRNCINTYNLRFDERLRNHEDHIFTLQYLNRCNKVSITKEYGCVWHVQTNSNSLSHRIKDWQQLLFAAQMLNEWFNVLFKRCSIRKDYMDYLRSKYVIGNVRASVYYLYKTQKGSYECIKALKQIIPQIRLYLKQYNYNPKDYKHRIIAIFLASHLPINFKHIVLKHLYK